MNKVDFFRCEKCGNIVELIHNGGGELYCCGVPMILLQAQTADAAGEKHVPVVEELEDGILVKVGSVPHPMVPEHWIEWIAVVTEDGIYRKSLNPGEAPEKKFEGIKNPITVYEYCNIHSLWKVDL